MSDTPDPRGFRFSSAREQRIHEKLSRVSIGAQVFFKDACQIMAGSTGLESATHLVGHLIREVYGSLLDVLMPISAGGSAPPRSSEATEEEEKEGAKVERILKALDVDKSDPLAQTWLRLVGKFHRIAHRSNLAPPRPVSQAFLAVWEDTLTVFEKVLERLEARYLAYFALIDKLVEQKDRGAAAKRLAKEVPNNQVTLGHFFNAIATADWIGPLRTRGFFRHPPPAEKSEDSVRCPWWPASRYLARVASQAPKQVLEVLLEIPETDNSTVHHDLAVAACALAPPLAAEWARRETRWLAKQQDLFSTLPDQIGRLVDHLARGGQLDEALGLTGVLLELSPAPGDSASHPMLEVDREPRLRISGYMYEQFLRQQLAGLVDAGGQRTLEFFAVLLRRALELSSRDPERPFGIPSIWWRPAIEDHEQNRDRGTRGWLISAVRDAAERLCPSAFRETLQCLKSQEPRVFRRLVLHVVRLHGAPSDVAHHLGDRTLFDDVEMRHEYVLLARDRLSEIREEDRQTILGWIEAGPDADLFCKGFKAREGRSPSADEEERHADQWRAGWFAPIKDALPPDWREKYEALIAKLGREPEHPEFLTFTWVGFVAPRSPKTAEEILSRPMPELLSFLKTWTPTGSFDEPSVDGLGRALAMAVAQKPDLFAVQAPRFRELEPTYGRYLLDGLTTAAKQGVAFDWEPVLDFCGWVGQQRQGDSSDFDVSHERDLNWGPAKREVVRLLEEAFTEKEPRLDASHRQKAWAGLEPLTRDPEPTPEHEERYGGSNMDPVTLAINTTRGAALEAAIRYGAWVKESSGKSWNGLESVPELRAVLEERLDPSVDPSPAIRSTYGRWLYWLLDLDKSWLEKNIPRIFPSDSSLSALRNAAWEAFVVQSRPHLGAFKILKNEYRETVQRLDQREEVEPRRFFGNPTQSLAEHLTAFYWWGELDIDDEESMLRMFYGNASDELRAHAITFAGRSFRESEGIPDDLRQRMERFWEWRMEEAAANPARCRKELAAYAWWFGSGKLRPGWALDQLEKVLGLSPHLAPESVAMEGLRALVDDHAEQAVRCLALFLLAAMDDWRVLSVRDDAKAILRTALASGRTGAQTAARELVNRLVAQGFVEFREVLEGKD